MSKIYEALQRAQEEREGATVAPELEGEPRPRRPWWRGRAAKTNGATTTGNLHIDFDLARVSKRARSYRTADAFKTVIEIAFRAERHDVLQQMSKTVRFRSLFNSSRRSP